MNTSKQKGIALILTLILVLVMSVMAVSLMFLSQTETWSTMNYRLMSQARDGAEAGINAASNFILNNNTTYPYSPPDLTGTDPITAYDVTKYPVQDAAVHSTVILSASPNATANYPYATAKNNYNTTGVGKGSLTTTSGNVTLT